MSSKPTSNRTLAELFGLNESLLALDVLERSTRVGLWIHDADADDLSWSAGTYGIHGVSPEQFKPTVDGMIAFYAPASRQLLMQAMEQAVNAGRNWNLDLELMQPDGTRKWVQVVGQAQQTDGRVSRVIGGVIDIGATRDGPDESRQRLVPSDGLQYHDPLTGLPNRQWLEKELTVRLEQTARDGRRGGWLLYLGLDRFKWVNESGGYGAGDHLILELVPRLTKALQPGGLLIRFSASKFAVLIAAQPVAIALQQAQALIAAVDSSRFKNDGRSITVGLSVGAVGLDTAGPADLKTVLRQAEACCRVAKLRGGGRVTLYSSEDAQLAEAEHDLIWSEEVQLALDENRFRLYAQRIVCIDGQAPPGYEILIRLQMCGGEVVPPDVFFPAMRRYGLMTLLDCRVIELVLEQLRNGLFQHYPCSYIAVNLSAPSYCDEIFVDFLLSALLSSGVAPEKLRFEITESEALPDLKTAQATVRRLNSHGFRVMLDDFGNGFTTFSDLRHLNIGGLKIDNSYTHRLDRDPFNQAVVACICDLCARLQLELIVEGVEDQATLDVLRPFNVRYAQGWLFHRPEPLLQALAGGVNAPASVSSTASKA